MDGTTMFRIVKKLRNVKRRIRIWNKEDFGHIFQAKSKAIDNLSEIQEKIQKDGFNDNLRNFEKATLTGLHNIISREEAFWKPRSQIDWLNTGDKNTKFFYLSTLKNRASNWISAIKSEQGLLTEEKDIKVEALNFFSSLLSKDLNIPMSDQAEVVSSIPSLILPHHNDMLLAIPNILEVKKALFSLPIDKAPSLDGFPTLFFQTFWDIINQDLVKAVQEFFGARNLLKEINSTFLVLIPKTLGVDSMGQFRPISLCNALYKIIFEVLTSRLVKVLPLIISPQ